MSKLKDLRQAVKFLAADIDALQTKVLGDFPGESLDDRLNDLDQAQDYVADMVIGLQNEVWGIGRKVGESLSERIEALEKGAATEDQIEAAAQAGYIAWGGEDDWNGTLADSWKADWRNVARAVYKVMQKKGATPAHEKKMTEQQGWLDSEWLDLVAERDDLLTQLHSAQDSNAKLRDGLRKLEARTLAVAAAEDETNAALRARCERLAKIARPVCRNHPPSWWRSVCLCGSLPDFSDEQTKEIADGVEVLIPGDLDKETK